MLREVRVLQALVTSKGNVHVNAEGAYIAVNGGWLRGRISWLRESLTGGESFSIPKG